MLSLDSQEHLSAGLPARGKEQKSVKKFHHDSNMRDSWPVFKPHLLWEPTIDGCRVQRVAMIHSFFSA